jgi:hypothetical protein
MLMMGPKKKMAATIVGKLKGSPDFVQKLGEKSEEVDMTKPEVDADPGLMSAAEDLVSAIEAKDAKKVMSVLKSFYSMCEMGEDKKEDLSEI